jgi:hypothetical protein
MIATSRTTTDLWAELERCCSREDGCTTIKHRR